MKQKILFLLAALACLFIFSIFIYRYINNSEGKKLEKEYTIAKDMLENSKTAEITYSDIYLDKKLGHNKGSTIEFSYKVDGKTYTNKTTLGNESILKMYVTTYTKIYYDPNDPNNYTFDPQKNYDVWKDKYEKHTNSFPIIAILFIVLAFLFFKKYSQAPKKPFPY